MSQDYGIDNEGTGFDFDDEEDIEQLFNQMSNAAKPGEDDDDDSHLNYINNGNTYTQEVSDDYEVPQASHNEEVEEEPTEKEEENAWEVVEENSSIEEEIQHDIPTYDNEVSDEIDDDYENHETFEVEEEVPAVQEYPQRVYSTTSTPAEVRDYTNVRDYTVNPNEQHRETEQQENIVSQPQSYSTGERIHRAEQTPIYQSASSASSYSASTANTAPVEEVHPRRRLNIPSAAEEIAQAQKVIKTLDVYRSLTNKSAVAQLIYNQNDVDPNDEASLVVRALNADPIHSETMSALREAALQKDRVERVFFILRLNRNVLDYLGPFLTTLSGAEFTDRNDQISYSKEIETAVNNLDPKVVQIVADAQSVLSAANE